MVLIILFVVGALAFFSTVLVVSACILSSRISRMEETDPQAEWIEVSLNPMKIGPRKPTVFVNMESNPLKSVSK